MADLASIRAQVQEISEQGDTITGMIAEIETRLQGVMGALDGLSVPAQEMVAVAMQATTPALGALAEARRALDEYTGTLTDRH